ncbi:MAG TPA: hypothetical protein VJL29_11235 [Thermoguttaceae bacterium]|nr:hypothetical protein [Thermoguttaceae bacterium]
MVLHPSRLLWVVALATACLCAASQAEARHSTAPDLFYNYYVPAGPNDAVGAEMYVSPRPTPPLVGHTWVTYQPLLPHEYLYKHKRTYVRRNPGAGVTVTKVCYGHHWLQSIVPTWMDGKVCKHIFVNPFDCYGTYYCR